MDLGFADATAVIAGRERLADRTLFARQTQIHLLLLRDIASALDVRQHRSRTAKGHVTRS